MVLYMCLDISKSIVESSFSILKSRVMLFIPSGHMTLKKRQVLVEFWSVRHLTLRQRHSDVRFITSYTSHINVVF